MASSCLHCAIGNAICDWIERQPERPPLAALLEAVAHVTAEMLVLGKIEPVLGEQQFLEALHIHLAAHMEQRH